MFSTHDTTLGARPTEEESRLVRSSRHLLNLISPTVDGRGKARRTYGVVTGPEGGATNDGEVGNGRVGNGVDKVGTSFDDTCFLVLLAHHEPRDYHPLINMRVEVRREMY